MRKRTLTLPRGTTMTLAVTLTLVLTGYTGIYLIKNGPISEYLGWVFLFVFFQFVFDLVVIVDDVVPRTRELIKVFIQLEVFHDRLQQRGNDLVKQECIPLGCVPPARRRTGGGFSVQGGLCPGGGLSDRDTPPHCERNHRCLWKHYLAATSFRAVITTQNQ